MKTFRYRYSTEYSIYQTASYGILRAATRLDKYVNVLVDSLLVKGTEDAPEYEWYFEFEAESDEQAKNALDTALFPFPVALLSDV